MFDHCTNLKYLNLSHFDTSKISNIYGMFLGCNSLIYLNLYSFKLNNTVNKTNFNNNINEDLKNTNNNNNFNNDINNNFNNNEQKEQINLNPFKPKESRGPENNEEFINSNQPKYDEEGRNNPININININNQENNNNKERN
jgi:surface protein